MKTWKSRIKKMIYFVIVIYLIGGVVFYFFQEKIFFQSVAIDPKKPFEFSVPFKEETLVYNAEYSFSVVKFFASTPKPKGVILYFHGNRININRYAQYAPNFTKYGYEVWMFDYPTYGKTAGKLTEEILYTEALEVYKKAAQNFNSNQIIIYGKSLGTGLASYTAAHQPCQQLILETPYYSFSSVASQWAFMYPKALVKFNIPAYQFIQQVKCPITIFHGTSDRTIFYSNAQKLKPLLKHADEFITIKGGGHNNLVDYDLYKKKLEILLTP